MRASCAPLVLLAAFWGGAAGAQDGQAPAFAGRVDISPVPAAKVLPGQGGGDEVAAVTDSDGLEVRVLPTVLRPGQQADDAQDTEQSGPSSGPGADDTDTDAPGGRIIKAARDPEDDESEERDSRFKKVPFLTPDPHVGPRVAPIEGPDTELMGGARLRQLDKMTGSTTTFEVPVGEARQVARLMVRLDACRAPDDNDTHGTMAYLKVWDTRSVDGPAAFSGWMFAESPALSALDHPRYDLWVISCTTPEGEASAARE